MLWFVRITAPRGEFPAINAWMDENCPEWKNSLHPLADNEEIRRNLDMVDGLDPTYMAAANYYVKTDEQMMLIRLTFNILYIERYATQ
jgi:hypothetical protein